MYDYGLNDLLDAYRKLKVQDFQVVLVESDLAGLGFFENTNKCSLLEGHLNALQKQMGNNGTIVVPTACPSLMGSDVPFDSSTTPSERGLFSEYVRNIKDAIRSFHPFNSYTALGIQAEQICKHISRHAYGPETPMGRMIESDTLCISIGLKPHITCSTLHQIELVVGVPYRYTKEFVHPVKKGSKITYEPFYIHRWYEACGINNHNKKDIWAQFEMHEKVNKASVGRGRIYSYSMKSFYKYITKLFNENMYILLENEPETKPYT